jgi:carbon-monoxide dehydrogenase medium subunit
MDGDTCRDAAVALGTVGLTPVRVAEAESSLRGQRLDVKAIDRSADAAQAAADPQTDMRGSVEYKRALISALTRRAIQIAARRARGEHVEAGHYYA